MYEGIDYEGNIVRGELEKREDGSYWIGSWNESETVWTNSKVDKDTIKPLSED